MKRARGNVPGGWNPLVGVQLVGLGLVKKDGAQLCLVPAASQLTKTTTLTSLLSASNHRWTSFIPSPSSPRARSASPALLSPPRPSVVALPRILLKSIQKTVRADAQALRVRPCRHAAPLLATPKSYRSQHSIIPRCNVSCPRPCLSALRAYLFAPQMRTLLDVMAWSSAQPHSVEDMVLHVFGNDRDQLVAV
ncbi:hypothetical protein BJV74DRAFT_870893 [Russula compacta]|nr:hypothetical protein BJV74DRAFT_870893 [Russula compacta]